MGEPFKFTRSYHSVPLPFHILFPSQKVYNFIYDSKILKFLAYNLFLSERPNEDIATECNAIFPFRITTSQTHNGSSRLQDLYIIPNTVVIWRLMFDTRVCLFMCLFHNSDDFLSWNYRLFYSFFDHAINVHYQLFCILPMTCDFLIFI